MTQKNKKSLPSEHEKISMPIIYSNTFGIGYFDTEVVLNFGFSTQSYFEPHDEEDVPVARVVLSWEIAESLLNSLKEILDEYKKAQKTERKAKDKAERG